MTAVADARQHLPIGAEPLPGEGVRFRVWAPKRRRIEVVLENEEGTPIETVPLEPERNGYFSTATDAAQPGALYRFRLDGGKMRYPDPASRFQPRGPHGPSQVIDADVFQWTDDDWRGVTLRGQVLYEMHIGTFTQEGTWEAAIRELPELARLGVTVLEVMPVADFAGRFGWGYDGVNLFAPTRLYGMPDELRRFVDRAHELGLGVILDMVYNHLGPDGNYLKEFSDFYFSRRYKTDWGEAINFDDEHSAPVREYILANAEYWIREFHVDGLRLDATQDIFDASEDHILAALTRRVRAAGGSRETLLIAENEPQQTRLVRQTEEGGFGMDALWNDDFHHTAMVLLSGRREAYYTDYLGGPQEFISAVKYGFLYQGQWYGWQKQRRGTPTFGLSPETFVLYIQNHDQIANTAKGLRAHQVASSGRYKAMTALLLLAPGTPMLFQGQEFAASSRFFYFADHKPELMESIDRGRNSFMAQFPSLAPPEIQAHLPRAGDPDTFFRSKLNLAERVLHHEIYSLHADLLRLRREDPVFGAQRPGGVDGAVLGPEAFVLRFFGERGDDRLLIVNFDRELGYNPAPEPLLAPPENRRWDVLFSTEDFRYGGSGLPPIENEDNWHIPAQAAVVLAPAAVSQAGRSMNAREPEADSP